MGAVQSANKVDGYKPELLNHTDSNQVLNHLKVLEVARNCNRQTKIIIVNKSSYPLQYKDCNSYSGFFFTETQHAFANEDRSIAPGRTGGILHTKNSDSACGSVGYVSFRVPTPGKNYVVCCGFSTVYTGTNSMGLEIRGEDGVLDAAGNISGHGVDPTGNVSDINNFVSSTYHAYNEQCSKTERREACRVFQVKADFINTNWSEFWFVVEDVVDKAKDKQ